MAKIWTNTTDSGLKTQNFGWKNKLWWTIWMFCGFFRGKAKREWLIIHYLLQLKV